MEPVYEYVKGKGWVLQINNQFITMACGTVVRMVARKPKPGERYNAALRSNREYFNVDGTPVWNRWAVEHKNYRYLSMPLRVDDNGYPGDLYITLEPV